MISVFPSLNLTTIDLIFNHSAQGVISRAEPGNENLFSAYEQQYYTTMQCYTYGGVFNASTSCFEYQTFKPMVRAVLAELFNNTLSDDKCSEWVEVSELKYLFRASQPWTRESAHQFLNDAWNYIGYE